MASTEKLIIELDAKVGNLTQELDKINKRLDETDRNTQGADKSLSEFSSTAKNATVAVAGAVTAFTAFVAITAKSRQELQNLSATANESTAAFEASAFALKNFGLEASDTAQLFNDIGEAASEFANVQSGPFQDLADQLGITKDEATALAEEVKELSGTDALVRLINVVNEADLSITDANQALKAISSDFQFLTPLVQSNAKELEVLTKRYNEANEALSLTAQQEQDLAQLAQTTSLLTDQLGNSAALISASVAPIFNDFFNAVIEIVPEATNTLVDFFNKFQEASSINSIDSIDREIAELTQTAADYEEQLQSLLGLEYVTTDFQDDLDAQAEGLSIVNQRLFELQQQREALIEQQARIDEVTGREGGDFTTQSVSPLSPTQSGLPLEEDAVNQLAIIEERLKSEEQLLAEKLEREQELVGDNYDLQAELYEEYLENLDALDQKRLAQVEREQKAEANATKKSNDEKLDSQLAYADAAINIGNLLFEDNKALRAGLVVADVAAGIVRAFADLPYPAAIAASASIAATGAAQLSAINSASKGGGGSVSSSSAAPVDVELPEEASELSVSAGDVSGANQGIIIRFEGGGDEITEAIAKNIKVMQINGTLEA